MAERRRKLGLAVCLLIVLSAVMAMFSFWFLGGVQEKTTVFSSSEAGVSLSYSEQLSRIALSEQDKQQKVVLRLTQGRSDEEDLLATLRYEEGLKKAAAVTKQNVRDMLKDNLRKSYPQRYPGFKELNQRDFLIGSGEASEIIFTYENANADTIKQRFLLFVVSDDKAVYLSAQAEDATFDDLNERYFDPIFRSLAIFDAPR